MSSLSDQPTRELAGGARMPVLGLGVWQLAAGAETEQAVEWALEAGYRHVDTASMYRNEQSVGAALKRSGLPREQVFVTTKLMPTHANAAQELEKSLRRLSLDYVDLYLIHWPLPFVSARLWRALESLRERGLAREIGVSNFGHERLARLNRGAAHSPLERGRGLQDPTIAAVAERLGRTPAQVMLRWAIQHQAVVIPKSGRKERIEANARVFDFELADADMQLLDSLDRTNGTARARG